MRRKDTTPWSGPRASGATNHSAARLTETVPKKIRQPMREHVPYRDSLTNLPNRFLLADRLRQALLQSQRRGQVLAIAYLDLDGVDAIQEIHGRVVSDELLLSVSRRMKQVLREGDTLARWDSDEFVAMLVDLDAPKDSESVLDRLVLVASSPVEVGATLLHVKANIGITLYPRGPVDADLLLRHAEQASLKSGQHANKCYQIFDLDLSDAGW